MRIAHHLIRSPTGVWSFRQRVRAYLQAMLGCRVQEDSPHRGAGGGANTHTHAGRRASLTPFRKFTLFALLAAQVWLVARVKMLHAPAACAPDGGNGVPATRSVLGTAVAPQWRRFSALVVDAVAEIRESFALEAAPKAVSIAFRRGGHKRSYKTHLKRGGKARLPYKPSTSPLLYTRTFASTPSRSS